MELERKKKRRPPRKVRRPPRPEELMQEPEFRRWRYHAPGSLKRMAYEVIKRWAGKEAGPGRSWVERV